MTTSGSLSFSARSSAGTLRVPPRPSASMAALRRRELSLSDITSIRSSGSTVFAAWSMACDRVGRSTCSSAASTAKASESLPVGLPD